MVEIGTMAVQMEKEGYLRVRALFPEVHLRLMIDGVVAGNSPARVWANESAEPDSVFIWDEAHCYYLAGSDGDEAFNSSVERLLQEEIKPQALSGERRIYKVYCASSSWEKKAMRILGGVPPIRAKRRLYRYKKQTRPSSPYEIPPGFTIAPIDRKLLEKSTLGNVDDVASEIESCWSSMEQFLKSGFGVCVRNEEEIGCWCTAEYVSEGKCGIGVETVEKLRKRGFAALATQVFVEHCLKNDISAHWDCWAGNLPSVKTAERVGFTKVCDYAVLLGSLDDFEGLIIRANDLYRKGEYRKSAQTHEEALLTVGKGVEPYFYFNAACAWAKAGEDERAIDELELAVKNGWEDLERLRVSEALESLRGHHRWRKLLAKL
jgi:hypothetical protein